MERFITNSGGGFSTSQLLSLALHLGFRAIRLSAIPCRSNRREAAYTTLVWRISLTQSESHPGVKGRYETVSKVCRSSHRYIVCCDDIASVRGSTNHFPRCICLRTEQTYFSRRRTGWIQRRFHWGLNSVARFALLDIKRRVAVYSHA